MKIIIFHLHLDFPEIRGSHFPSQTLPFGGTGRVRSLKFDHEQFIGASRIETTHYISFLRMISLFGPILVPFEKGPKKNDLSWGESSRVILKLDWSLV